MRQVATREYFAQHFLCIYMYTSHLLQGPIYHIPGTYCPFTLIVL